MYYPQDDNKFQDTKVTKVNVHEKGWDITVSDGWSFSCDKTHIIPQVGDTARFYGGGLGSIVRGLFINEVKVFYRTEKEQDLKNKRDLMQHQLEKQNTFNKNQITMDGQYDALPQEFKNRIDRFRKNNSSFRWENEPYELFVCEEAVKLAKQFPNINDLKGFCEASHEEQTKLYPDMSNNHSGNTFGAACRLAYFYVDAPEYVELEHGALCPLVGCIKYGCTSLENSLENWLENK